MHQYMLASQRICAVSICGCHQHPAGHYSGQPAEADPI